MTVLALFRCRRYGEPGRPVDIQLRGETVSTGIACDTCVGAVKSALASARPVFELLLTIGVDRDTADEVMTFLLERWPERVVPE